ncbi:unnamed protein product [Leptosia nina]|uniref:A-kinase anchor protein 200 n=1 Tax=Leptosia nina TaxID=320188 RepID=A0AAV1ITI3_9NEOP
MAKQMAGNDNELINRNASIMGAKQSKRSVDISGKEAESAGEVAAAGAGGEGRMEQLADADALKPQANGDAHIHETPEKEKQLDSGTPENEKDATTEKEMKEQDESEKEKESAVTNGESEPKAENGDDVSSPDDGKKKKEKVKKKWSLRSISFSRKDKPKQEKKQKDKEIKTNGETEEVPEEAAESTPEVVEKEVAAETKSDVEKDEKTPETPVTEPLTNGSSTPESPKVESPIPEEPKNEVVESDPRPEPKVEAVEPQKLLVNGQAPEEETKKEEPTEVPVVDSNKTEEPKIEVTETVPSCESPVKKEVCVDQTPLIEPTPPPLPANPPPSSVASFAATTMAPELIDASLANKTNNIDTVTADETPVTIENSIPNEPEITETIKSNLETEPSDPKTDVIEQIIDTNAQPSLSNEMSIENSLKDPAVCDNSAEENIIPTVDVPIANESDSILELTETKEAAQEIVQETTEEQAPSTVEDISKDSTSEISKFEQDSGICELKENDIDTSIHSQNELNGTTDTANESEMLKTKGKEIIENNVDVMLNGDAIVMNGNESPAGDSVEEIAESGDESVKGVAESVPPSLSEALEQPAAAAEDSESFPLPPSDLCPTESEISAPASPEPLPATQETLPIADKMADLIPELPTVPDLNTETVTTTDIAVEN